MTVNVEFVACSAIVAEMIEIYMRRQNKLVSVSIGDGSRGCSY